MLLPRTIKQVRRILLAAIAWHASQLNPTNAFRHNLYLADIQ